MLNSNLARVLQEMARNRVRQVLIPLANFCYNETVKNKDRLKFSKKILILLITILIIAVAYFAIKYYKNNAYQDVSNIRPTSSLLTSIPTVTQVLAEPIAQFKEKVTKKPFGIYITPQNSPVQPEKFTGFHTGADVEYQDVIADVAVYALADGTIVLARTASGYGGVMVINFQLNGVEHTAVYGHIRPSSLPQVGQVVHKGDQIGLLGTGYSAETDGERRHLHFAILADNRIDLKGYVQSQSELTGWLYPL